MEIRLSGLQEASRALQRVEVGIMNARKILEDHIETLKADIVSRFGPKFRDVASKVEVEHDGESIIISLPYDMGMNSKGRPKVSARKAHNPQWPEFSNQPFQDALRDAGYTDIEPAPGRAIETSKSTAPNVRIMARLPESLLREISGVI